MPRIVRGYELTSAVSQLPEKISFEDGASLPLAYSTAAVGLYHQAGGPQCIPPWAEGGKNKYANTPIVILGVASVVGSLGKHTTIGCQRWRAHPRVSSHSAG